MEELEMHVIELPKFKYKDIEKMNKKEEWILYLKGCDDLLLQKIKRSNKNIALLDKLIKNYWREEKME